MPDRALGGDAVWIVRSRHWLDGCRWQCLGRVRTQLAGIGRDGLTRIDRRVVVWVWTWLHHDVYWYTPWRAVAELDLTYRDERPRVHLDTGTPRV
jgi:hypothetical protein